MKNIIKKIIISTGFLTEFQKVRKFVGGEWSHIECSVENFDIWVNMNATEKGFAEKYNLNILKVERWDG